MTFATNGPDCSPPSHRGCFSARPATGPRTSAPRADCLRVVGRAHGDRPTRCLSRNTTPFTVKRKQLNEFRIGSGLLASVALRRSAAEIERLRVRRQFGGRAFFPFEPREELYPARFGCDPGDDYCVWVVPVAVTSATLPPSSAGVQKIHPTS